MSDQRDSVPPCWAADPSGRHRFRYWDGTAWTGHVFDGETPPLTAPGPPPTESLPHQPEPAQPSEYTRTQGRGEPPAEHRADAGEELGPPKHQGPARARRSFWMGALVGGLVVAILAAIAWVALDEGSSSKTTVATPATSTTSLKTTSTTSAVTTTTTVATRPPAEVRVEVLNASGVAGAAGSKAETLRTAGYTIAGVGDATARQGTVVACKPGFDAEAAALAQAVGSGATTEPFPTPPPASSTDADCVVTLGT